MEQFKSRALLLGGHADLTFNEKSLTKAPVKGNSIDLCKFSELLPSRDQPLMNHEVDRSVNNLCSTLYECTRASKVHTDEERLAKPGVPNRWVATPFGVAKPWQGGREALAGESRSLNTQY